MSQPSQARKVIRVKVAQVATPAALDLVAAPGAKTRIYVARIVLTSPAAGTIKFTEGTGPTDLTGAMNWAANGGFVINGSVDDPVLWTETPGVKFSLVTSGAGSGANGWIDYFLDR